MPEEPVKSDWKDKAKSIAYSMKLVNGVYDKLIEVFMMQTRTEETDEYAKGWNAAFTTAAEMTKACKYTRDDFVEMMREGMEDEEETN